MPTGRSPTGENQGRGLARPGAKLSKRWSARWLGEASPRGRDPASSLPDLFLDLYQHPFFLSSFNLLLSALLFVQQIALAATCPPAPAPADRQPGPRRPDRKAALPAHRQVEAELFPSQSQ